MLWRCKNILLIVSLLCACSSKSDNEYRPRTEVVSIAYLKSLYRGYPLTLSGNMSIEGVLKSTDLNGNFHQTLIIEDQSGGIEVKIDLEHYFIYFPHSHKYLIRCNGLSLGSYGGAHQLGYPSADPQSQVLAIPEDEIPVYIGKSSDQEYPIMPIVLGFGDLKSRFISCWVGFKQVQFIDEELNMAWAENEGYTYRHLINENGDTLHVTTGASAAYANTQLPTGSGSIEGVLSCFNDEYSLRLPSLYYVVMDSPRFVCTRREESDVHNSF